MISPFAVGVKWRKILRLRFRKGIPSRINSTFCTFQLEIADEFDVVQDVEIQSDRLSILIKISNSGGKDDVDDIELNAIVAPQWRSSLLTGGKPGLSCRVTFPEVIISSEKRYQFYISYDSGDSQLFILPLQSDYFFVTLPSSQQLTAPEQEKFLSLTVTPSILCTNYRTIIFDDSISCVIKEDYGATIGSHIYDCSIILSKYLLQNSLASSSTINVKTYNQIIELGAGCGLTSILCGKITGKSVLSTDRRGQLQLLQKNIITNEVQDCVQCLELDWEFNRQIQHIFSVHLNDQERNRRTLILAADVLYDRDAAKSLHQLLHQFHTHISKIELPSDCEIDTNENKHTCDILLVYKNRNGMTDAEVLERVTTWCAGESTLSRAMSCSLLYSEALVYIFILAIVP